MTPGDLSTLIDASLAQRYPRVSAEPLLSEFFPSSFTASAGPAILLEHLENGSAPYPSQCYVLQPCVRYWDIGQVGDATHLSFFQMVACASFLPSGRTDTLAEIATFLTNDCGLDRSILWATLFEGGSVAGVSGFDEDFGAREFWTGFGLDPKHLTRVDSKEGFVANQSEPIGGYRTEAYLDLRPDQPGCVTCAPTYCKCGRFLELATSVAYEYSVACEGETYSVKSLGPERMYAAGFGLERLQSVLQGNVPIYEIPQLHAPIGQLIQLGIPGTESVRLVDAVRALLFLFSEGAGQLTGKSNKGRRWVLNKWINVLRELDQDHKITSEFMYGIAAGFKEAYNLSEGAESLVKLLVS